ncbi:hypothetical protein BC940DRAFT_308584 [Gongronella butleri]|nr:hypothetical protein BC940DRAFT_308584 [Gongronella butleri]
MPPRFGGAPSCPRCSKAVYMAEQVIGPGGAWHKNCLTCIECNKRLDSTTLTEREGEAYCKVCYGRKWGPKGYGFAGGAAFLSTETKMPKDILAESDFAQQQELLQQQLDQESRDQRQFAPFQQKMPPAPSRPQQQQRQPSPPPAKVPSPALPPRRPIGAVNDTPEPSPVRATPPPPAAAPSIPARPQPSYLAQTSYVPKKFSMPQNDICVKCRKAVYAAELALGAGNKYHKHCLKCTHCSKSLNSNNMQDKDFDLYCRPCYSKLFGPKGYGYGNLLSTEGTTR